MGKIKRKKTVVIRKSDIKQIVAYPETRVQKETIFGNRFDELVDNAKAIIFCETSKDRIYTINFKDTGDMYDWLDEFQKQIEDTESGSFIRLDCEDL